LLSTFSVTNTADSGAGSLREAILDSNAATAATNTIKFAIPGSGVRTISPLSALPPITQSVLIDGTSQPGYVGTPLIALGGPTPGKTSPLAISGSDVSIRGLAIDRVAIDPTTDENLIAVLVGGGHGSQLSLRDASGGILVQSNGVLPDSSDPVIDEHLAAGDYPLGIDGGAGPGTFTMTTMLTPAATPFQAIPVGLGPQAIVAGDFTGDDRTDLAVANRSDNTVSVLLGNGDGTFQPQVTYAVGKKPIGIVAADLTGDDHLDLAVVNNGSNNVSVLLGNGDGTFQPEVTYAVGPDPDAIVAGDFGDGRTDLAVANQGNDTVSVLQGNGHGGFQPHGNYLVGNGPDAIVAGDFGDGRTDLAVANAKSNTVSVLLGNGYGKFRTQVQYPVGSYPDAIVAGDFNGDGRTDLAVANGFDNTVSVLLGKGDGIFQPHGNYAVGSHPDAIVAGDFTGDGRTDLAVASHGNVSVSVLLGNGDGTFQPQVTYVVGNGPEAIVAGDFTGDGRTDLAVANFSDNTVSVLLGNGDGTFQPQVTYAVASNPEGIVAGDFNGDFHLDLAVVNAGTYPDYSGSVSVLLGNGDGTFQPQVTYAVGNGPIKIVAGDFNGDGRTDLAVVNAGRNPDYSGSVSVLLGNGDGTFQPQVQYPVGKKPIGIVTADFTGDFHLDLAVVNAGRNPDYSGSVSVLLGNGDGTFQPEVQYPVGSYPDAIVAGDFNGDGRTDLAVVNAGTNLDYGGSVSVLLGNGYGKFQPQVQYPVGSYPDAIVAGDFGDGRTDLAVANWGDGTDGTVSVLQGNGHGGFQPHGNYPVGNGPEAIVAGDFTGDGRTDLAVTGSNPTTVAGEVSVLLGNGDGTFQPQVTYEVGFDPDAIVAGDFTGDGRTDLAVANFAADTLSVLLGNGDGTFSDPGQVAISAHTSPVVADVNGDGTPDVLVLDSAGNILYRQGIPGRPGNFEPPVTINPGAPSHDIAWVPDTDVGVVLASVDAGDNKVSFYAWRDSGFVKIGSLTTDRLPAQIIAADLNDNGWTDLVVRNAADGTLSIYQGYQSFAPFNPNNVGPSFLPPVTIPVGLGVSDVQAIDTTGDGRLDLVVTNQLSGLVGILRNMGDRTFGPLEPYRAGTGPSAVDISSSPEVTSLEDTSGVAAAPLTHGGPTSLVTANPGSNTLGVLAGLGGGLFASPVAIDTPHSAQVVRLAKLTRKGNPDLVLLGPTGVTVMLGDGKGGFGPPVTYNVGPEPTGLTIADLTGNGIPDLLVSNAYGDLLVLLGNGDGTFQTYHEANQGITLAVTDLEGNGSKDIIYADQNLNRVVVKYGGGRTTVLGNYASGVLSPGAVTLADLTGNGILDLIVANSGSNNVLIYPGLGNGQFGPAINSGHGYFVGTNPVGITVANLTGALPDLVIADKGSNQVTILLNQSQGGNLSFRLGPRLNSGGIGPVSTAVGNFTPGSANPDILVSNSGSNDVTLLPGVGQGFFNDTNPQTFAVHDNPGPVFVGNFDGRTDLVTINAGSNDLTVISNFMSADSVTTTISSGGTDPVTAFSFSAQSGFDDLVVGNGGDGVLALFEGSDKGLTLTTPPETSPDLPSPSALWYSGMAGGDVQFYAASAGREAAVLVALSLGGEIVTISPPTPTSTVAQLAPLQDSSLALVGTFLITTLPSSATEVSLSLAETEIATTVTLPTTAPAALGQGSAGQSRGEEVLTDGDEPSPQPEPAKAAIEPAAASWQHHVLGTDSALEEFDREHPDLFAPRPDVKPPARRDPAPGQGPAPSDRQMETIDQSIEQMHDEDPAPRRVGEIHQQDDHIKIAPVRFNRPSEEVEEQRYDTSAAMAIAATVASEFYFGSARRRTGARSWFARRASALSQRGTQFGRTSRTAVEAGDKRVPHQEDLGALIQ
jgi:hypothetical protein